MYGNIADPYVMEDNPTERSSPTPTPRRVPAVPMKPDSSRKSLIIKPSSAPIHFIVPISLNRSVTDISIAFVIPTRQTRRDRTTSQLFLERSRIAVALSGSVSIPFFWRIRSSLESPAALIPSIISVFTHIDIRKAIASTIPLTVIRERPNRIFTLNALLRCIK